MSASAQRKLAPVEQETLPAEIIKIDPPTYVAAVYQPFNDRLDKAMVEAPKVSYDIATTAGMQTAVEWRRTFREIRVDAEKERKARKAPILEIGKLLDSTYKELEAKIEPLEDRFDGDIKAEEARKEAIRAEAARVELARVQGIQAKIEAIKAMAETHGKTSAQLDDAWQLLDQREIAEEEFAEFIGQAQNARVDTLAKLHEAYLRVDKEEKDRAEFERKKAEHAALVAEQAERDRIAKEKREAEEAELKRKRDALAEEERQAEVRRKAAQDALDKATRDQAAALARQQAEIDRQRRELEDQQRQAAEAEQERLRKLAEPEPQPEPPPAAAQDPEPEAPVADVRPRPSDAELIECIAGEFGVDLETAREWLEEFPLSPI